MSRPLETVVYDLEGVLGQQYVQNLKDHFRVVCRVSADAEKRLGDVSRSGETGGGEVCVLGPKGTDITQRFVTRLSPPCTGEGGTSD